MVKRIDVLLFDGESNVSCVRASDYDALAAKCIEHAKRADVAENRILELEAAIKIALENEISLDNERCYTWHVLNDALASDNSGGDENG